MDYNWTKEEIALTRRAWTMYDLDREYKFACVSWVVGIAAIVFITWVLI